jgi:hypothetical protein
VPGRREPAHIADHRNKRRRGRDIHPRDRHQPLDFRILERVLGDQRVDLAELLAKKVELAKARVDGEPLVDGQDLIAEPLASFDAEQVGDRRPGDEVALQHRRDLVLDLRATLHQPTPPRNQPSQRADPLISDPDLGIRSAASRSANTRASSLSVFTRAWLIALTC